MCLATIFVTCAARMISLGIGPLEVVVANEKADSGLMGI